MGAGVRGGADVVRAGERAFLICGLAYLAAAGSVAVVHAVTGVTRGWWLVAFLSLVGGVAQLLLGPGLLALVGRSGARVPSPRQVLAELVLWNGGTAAVALADLADSMAGVLAGSVLLLAALVLFARGLRAARATAHRRWPAWDLAYGFLLAFLGSSVFVGAWLAFVRGR